jgi:hypothetical protein
LATTLGSTSNGVCAGFLSNPLAASPLGLVRCRVPASRAADELQARGRSRRQASGTVSSLPSHDREQAELDTASNSIPVRVDELSVQRQLT